MGSETLAIGPGDRLRSCVIGSIDPRGSDSRSTNDAHQAGRLQSYPGVFAFTQSPRGENGAMLPTVRQSLSYNTVNRPADP